MSFTSVSTTLRLAPLPTWCIDDSGEQVKEMSSSSVYRRLHGLFTTSFSAATKPEKTAITVIALASTNVGTEEEQLQKMVDDFKTKSESRRFRNKQDVYNSTVRRLASAKKFTMIEDLLESQKQYDDITCEGFAIRLIVLYGKAGMYDHARALFDQLPDLKCERTVKSFNALTTACVKSKHLDEIETIFRDLPQELSIQVNVVSYNIVINALCATNRLDSALAAFHEMETKGIEPNITTFNTLLAAYYKNGQVSAGESIWNLMESKSVSPNKTSHNWRLQAMTSMGKTTQAVEVLDEMKKNGLEPDITSFNALIRGACANGNSEEAKRWLDELKQSGLSPNQMTFSTILPRLIENGDYDSALELSMEAINSQLLINAEELKQVVNGLVGEDKVEEAKKLVELGNSNNYFDYKLELPLTNA